MTDPLQTLQLALFGLSILTLLTFGTLILARPVNVINRRWYLAVLLPLLLANPLAVLEEEALLTVSWTVDWRTWLVLAASIGLLIYFVVTLRGMVVYGLSLESVEEQLTAAWQAQGFTVTAQAGENQAESRMLMVEFDGASAEIVLSARFREVRIQPGSAAGQNTLRQALPALRDSEAAEGVTFHMAGVLYIVLAVVFAVMSWIFFFEPRLVLLP